MVRGLFTAWNGLETEQKRLDVIANNMANSATVGFKAENVTNQAFKDVMTIKVKDISNGFIDQEIGTMSRGVKIGEVYSDYSQGSLRETGNDFDIALSGKGFFAISVTDAKGNTSTKYTRDGLFTMDRNGNVVDCNGNRLQTESGTLQVPTDASRIAIDSSGNVFADDVYVDTIKVVDFVDYNYREKFADNMYGTVDGAKEIKSNASVIQGYTEQSNVNVIGEMVEMINITRAYEANQKVMQTIDSSLDQVVNTVGKL